MTTLRQTWASEEWRGRVQLWISQVLPTFGLSQVGPLMSQHITFWSTQLVVPTDQGKIWFKENNPGQFAEASIMAALADIVPDHVSPPLAIEPSKGWMLTFDHGATLSSLHSDDSDIWVRALTDFADLQRSVVPHVDTLTTAGLVIMNPEVAANFVENQLLLHTGLPRAHPLHLAAADADHVLVQLPAVAEAVDVLRDVGVPLSLDHNDLHPGNAFLPGSTTQPVRFFDFADAYWAHPFSALFVPMGMMCEQWKVTPADPRIQRVISAYLEHWTDFAELSELRRALEPALQLARVHRYGSWLRLFVYADDESIALYGSTALDYLANLSKPVLT